MSNQSDKDATQQEKGKELTFADRVNVAVKELKSDDKGNLVFPEDADEAFKFSVIAEKRRRDTQSEYTRTRQQAKQLEAEKAELMKEVNGKVELNLTAAQAEELEDLKFSNPEEWRNKMNSYETVAKESRNKELNEKLKQVSTSSLEKEELEQRVQVLAEFNQEHPDLQISQELIDNDIPPRIMKKLETGAISFEAFLTEVYQYAKTGKVVKTNDSLDQPNLSKTGGGALPDNNAKKEDAILSYSKEIY